MKQLCSFLLLLCFLTQAAAQQLPRKGTLGIHMSNHEDGAGLSVNQVIEGTTAANLGLQTNDIILAVNDEVYDEVNDLVAAVGQWRQGDEVRVKLLREGKALNLKGIVTGRPFETSKNGTIHYGAVAYDGGLLRSILVLPKGVKNPPVVFFLPGIGCGTLDYPYNDKAPIKQLVEGLVDRGLAVYRVDKPNMGDGQGTKDCTEMDYHYEVEAFKTALQTLQNIAAIDRENIFLYGHSLGVITAPMIASQIPVKGVICWGGISTSWYEYELKRLRDQKVMLGIDYENIESTFRERQSFLYDFFVQKKTPKELAQVDAYQGFYDLYFPNNRALYYNLHHYQYFHQLNDVNFAAIWKKAACPTLALHGAYDIAAIDAEWAENIANIVNAYHPGMATWKIIDKTAHRYNTIPSMEEYLRLRAAGQYNAQYQSEHFNPAVVQVVSDWIQQILDA